MSDSASSPHRVHRDPAGSEVRCDVVMPVHNGLTLVMDAVESLLEGTDPDHYRLLIVDDASDHRTADYLAGLAVRHPHITVIRNSRNLGFVQSCIRGHRETTAPFLLLLNSDVVVSEGWLDRLLMCADRDPRVASVNPLTNHAAHLVVPMVPGCNFYNMDAFLAQRDPGCSDVVTGVGFCLLLRRSALDEVGFFDEVFGRGYCEDSDLCMRLTDNAFRTVIAENVYVYHFGSGSFAGEREVRYRDNRRIFDQRWGSKYRRQFSRFRAADPVGRLQADFRLKTRWDPLPQIWQTARELRTALESRSMVSAARSAVRGLGAVALSRREIPDQQRVEHVSVKRRLRVTYIVPRLVVAGGVLSVIQIVNGLVRLGVDARIATLFEDPLIYQWTRLYSRPMVFRDPEELIARCPESEIAVATLWSSAPWARALVDRGRARAGAYFLQDYEPWFFPETSPDRREQVKATFALLDHRIVKSDWLARMLADDGYATHKIPLGMDLAQFYPREVQRGSATVLAMARPGTPQRGFPTVVSALQRVKAARPEAEVVLFGDRSLRRQSIPFEFTDEGLISDQSHLAQVYSRASVFLDGSDFQGFGRCGLEAMACATACVMTDVGGVNEYARHDQNALLVPPGDPERLATAILDLMEDSGRRSGLIQQGLDTAQHFDHRREARDTLRYFESLLDTCERQ